MPEAELNPTPVPPQPPPAPPETPADSALALAREAPALEAILTRLRRRASRQVLAREVLLALAVALGLLLLAAGLVALKQSWARTAGWAGAGLALLVGLVRGVVFSSRVRRDDVAAARALGTVSPKDASDLVSAVELCRAAAAPDSNVSVAFVRAHLARMSSLAARLDPRPAVRATPVLTALGVAAGVFLLHLVAFKWGGQRLRDSYGFLAFRPQAESAALFAPEPIAGDVSLTYHYPAHMNRPVRTIPGTAGDITAPKGTLVDITARADRDVQQAAAVVILPGKPPQLVPLQVKGRELAGQLMISEPGEWRFRYMKASGATVAEGPGKPITIEPDAFPEVKITAPAAELEVDGDEIVTLSYEASDDYGLTQIDIVWSLGKGAPEQRHELVTLKDSPRTQRGQMSWPLAALGLQPGDRVTYRLEAFDNDSVAGRKKGVSATQVLKVFSETEHHEEILKKAQEVWEKLINGMGDRLEEPPFDSSTPQALEAWAKKTRAKDETLANVSNDMRLLARNLLDDKRAPAEIARALSHVGSRVGSAVEKTTDDRNFLISRPANAVHETFAASLAGEIREEEKGVLYLEDLIDRRRLLDLAEMARELQKGREELTRLIEQYKKAPSEEAKQQLMAQVARLKERLHALYKRMQELSQEIQDEHLNQEAQQVMQDGDDMLSQLDKLQEELAKGDSDAALKELEKLQQDLEKMEKQFGEHAGEADEEQQKIGRDLQQLASDLMDVEAEQRAVKKETDDLRQREREATAQRLKQQGQEFVQKQLDRLKKAKQEIDGIDPKTTEQFGDDETLQRLQERLEQLKQALQGNDYDEALDQAEQATQAERELQMRLSDEERTAEQFPELGREPGQFQEQAGHAEKADKPLRDIAQDLDNLMRKSRPPPSEAEKEQMNKLAQREGQLQRQTEQLQKKLDELGQKMPLFNSKQQKLLEGAADSMDGARDDLQAGDSRRSSANQSEALQKIQQLKQAMQDSKNNSGGGSGGVPMPFASTGEGDGNNDEGSGQQANHAPVVIPQAGESQAPAEFRKDLLDAMKDKAPDRYKERVRDYYEELVK